jgi:hypothetical protein
MSLSALISNGGVRENNTRIFESRASHFSNTTTIIGSSSHSQPHTSFTVTKGILQSQNRPHLVVVYCLLETVLQITVSIHATDVGESKELYSTGSTIKQSTFVARGCSLKRNGKLD